MSKPRDTIIYALVDPRTKEVRYVGKTKSKMCARIKTHLRHVRYPKNRNFTHKEAWLKGLIDAGMKPKKQILEIVPHGDDWASRERWWIATAPERGWKLTNLSIGGESGACGLKHTEEFKRKLAERSRGNKNSLGKKWTEEQHAQRAALLADPQFKARMSAAQKGKKHSEESKRLRSLRFRGASHPMAKLSALEVINLRERVAAGESRKQLANERGISHSHLCKIIRGEAWTCLV